MLYLVTYFKGSNKTMNQIRVWLKKWKTKI